MVAPCVLMVSPTVLNTPSVLSDIPQCTEHPSVLNDIPGVLHRHYAGWE